MADDGKLYLDWELKGNVDKVIRSTLEDAEKLQKALDEAGKSVEDLDASKMAKNLKKNINDATKTISDLLIIQSKLDETLKKSNSREDFGFDNSKLEGFSKQIDIIIEKLLHIGPAAAVSANAVKNLAAELSIDVIKKGSKEEMKRFDSAEKAYIKQQKDEANEAAKSEKDREDAEARSAQNMQKIMDAMSKIATARSNLSKISSVANQEESTHVRLLLSLLDQLSQKLAALKKTDLSAKDAVTSVLGSGYQNLMRNVTTAIADLASGKLNTMGASDEQWNQEKLLATRREITATFEKEYENQEKVNQLIRQRQEMEAHRKARETAKDEAEMKVVAEQINKELAARAEQKRQIEAITAAYKNLEKIKLDTESQKKIAGIKDKKAEYSALENKISSLVSMMERLKATEENIRNGWVLKDNFKELVTSELDAIQRKYNEDLARGQVKEANAASSRQKLTDDTKKAADATRNLQNANQGLLKSLSDVERASSSTSKIFSQMEHQFANFVSLYGLERMAKSIITIGGQFEFQHIALQNILGDLQEANILFTQLQGLAVESPKTFMELTSYAKQLSAYQIPAEELYDTTKRLADLSTGLGVDMSRLILAYGQVRSAAVLRGQELRQFTEAGIPLVQKLADKFTELNGKLTTTADVFKLISARKVPFEMVKDVMWDMTNQGGQFFNMQEELADTLYGKWQKLQDTWQIMLGHLADGSTAMGWFMRTGLEGIVALTRGLNSMLPVISAVAASWAVNKNKSRFGKMYQNVMESQSAISEKNMLLAKEKEANRLLNERYVKGKQLNAQEWELIRLKKQLTSNEYILLFTEGKISEAKMARIMQEERALLISKQQDLLMKGHTKEEIQQMTLDQRRNLLLEYRLFLMKGYTKEQIRQMQIGNAQMVQQEKMGLKEMFKTGGIAGIISGVGGKALSGLYNFIGGMPGLVLTAAGAIYSIYSAIKEGDEELSQKGDAMMSHAQQSANNLLKTIDQVENSNDSLLKKIEVLENALIEMGEEGKRIVADSRGLDNLQERFDKLNDSAIAYQITLQSLGTPEAKTLHEEALDDSDIEDKVKAYQDIYNEETKVTKSLANFDAQYRKMIDSMKTKHKELNDTLTSSNLFENLRTLMTGKYATEAITWYAGPARKALEDYYNAVQETQKAFNGLEKETIPKAMKALRAEAIRAGVDLKKPFEELSNTEKETLRVIANNFASSLEYASQDTKNSIANWVAQGFYAKLYLQPVVGKLFTGYAKQLNDFQTTFLNGRKIWSDQEMNEAIQDVLGFDKKNSKRWEELADNIKKTTKAIETATGDRKEALEAQLKADKQEKDDLDVAQRNGLWTYTPTKNGGSGGSKKDQELDMWKARISLLEKYRKDLEELEKYMTRSQAENKLREDKNYDALFGYFKNPNDYVGSINEAIKALGTNGDRKKFVDELGSKKSADALRALKENAKNAASELQRLLGVISENYNVYKKWLDLTGDSGIAAKMAGVAQNTSYADYLKSEMDKALKEAGLDHSAKYVLGLDVEGAKEYGEDTKIYKIWEEYRKEVERVRKEDMDELYNATKKLMTVDEEILAIEKQIEELRAKGAKDYDPRILEKQQELSKKQMEQFENSEPYLKFYAAILSMTADEAEAAGAAIKKNLVDKLADGTINADKYLKSIKNVDSQLQKIRSDKGVFATLATSGFKGLYERNKGRQEDDVAANAIKIEKAQKELLDAEIELQRVTEEGDRMSIANAEQRVRLAKEELEKLQNIQNTKQAYLESLIGDWSDANDIIAMFDLIGSGIDGLANSAQQLSNMFDALGQTSRAEGWSDAAGYISAIGSPVQSAVKAAKSAMSGDLGGVISNTVGIITSPITALANLHDKKLDRAIQKSVREVKKLGYAYQNIETAMEKALGGIYNTGGYNEMLRNLKRQREELQSQYEDEQDKKKSDADKLIDYQQQLLELDQQIKDFALDMANTLYSIDLHSIAGQLTDAVVSAWEKGEDAAEAYRDKVKDIVKDIATNILTRKVMEAAFERLGIDKIIENEMITKEGKLDEGSIVRLANALNEAGEITVNAITDILDQLDKNGTISKGDSTSSSASSSIKNITEETADILVSYVNAIRADVAYTRITLENIFNALHGDSTMTVIAQAQLDQLKLIVASTTRNADAADKIYDLLHGIAPDGQKVRVQ